MNDLEKLEDLLPKLDVLCFGSDGPGLIATSGLNDRLDRLPIRDVSDDPGDALAAATGLGSGDAERQGGVFDTRNQSEHF